MSTRQSICSYAAGYIDGEGCLSLHCKHTPRKDSTIAHHHKWRVTITSGDLKVLQLLQETFGGGLYVKSRVVKRQLYNWNIEGITAYNMLKELELIAKRDEQLEWMRGFEEYTLLPKGHPDKQALAAICKSNLEQIRKGKEL